MREVNLSIAQIVGSGICVSAPDGHRVHAEIYNNIVADRRVRLSFATVTRMTTAFLNAAIGQLYGEFPEEILRLHLAPPTDANPRQLAQLKLVVDRAKAYFKDTERAKTTFVQITGMEGNQTDG